MSTYKMRIKVKHLLLIIVLIPILIFILPYGYLFIADAISDKYPTAAVSMYKKFIAAPPFVLHKDKSLFSLALKSFHVNSDAYYEKLSTDGCSQNSSYISGEMLNTAVSLYEEILKEYKNSFYYMKAYNNLLFIYTYSANTEAGEKLINQGEASDKKAIRLIAGRYNLYYKLAKKQYSQVIKLGDKLLEEYGKEQLIYKFMAEASVFMQDFDRAINYYRKAGLVLHQKEDVTFYSLIEDTSFIDQAYFVEELKKNGNKNTLVTGRVSVLGKGIPFARVYLKEIGDTGMYSGEERAPAFGITDLHGNYTIKGAPVGNYKLLLRLPGFLLNHSVLSESSASNITVEESSTLTYNFDFVQPLKLNIGHTLKPDKGHVKLSWEPVSGAAYYKLHAILFDNPLKPIGNTTWVPISDEITSNSYNLDLAAVNMKATGYSIANSGALSPYAYLGIFYPGCSVPVYVEAYNKHGLRLTSSMPKIVLYDKLPVISVSNQQLDVDGIYGETSHKTGEVLDKAKRLILEGKPEEAEKILSEELKKNPDDIGIMNILSNIYRLGTRIILKSSPIDNPNEPFEKIVGRNLKRALELNDRLYSLTQNVEYIRKNYFIYAYELKDFEDLLKDYNRIPEAKLTGYDYLNLGEAKLKLGEFDKAEKDFNKMYKAFRYNQAADLNPILLQLYNKNFKNALIAIDQTNLRLYKVSVVQLKKDIREIQSKSISNSEYGYFKSVLRRLMQKSSDSTRLKDYKDLTEKIEDPQLTSIIKQAMSYHSIYE